MQMVSPGPPTPTTADGLEHKSFLGGALFTSPPEEVGDLLTESKRRKIWWGGEKDSLLPRRASRTEKKHDKGKQEKSKEKFTKGIEENSLGESKGEGDKVEKVEVKIETENERPQEEARKGAAEHPEKVEKAEARVEVVGKVEVVGNGSPPAGKDKAGEVRAMDKQIKVETAETETEDDIATSLRDEKSPRSLNSSNSTKGSRGSTKPGKKRWSLMIARKSTPEVPVLDKKLTEDVAGPRFEAVKEPEGERCAGDNPSIYVDGFVSSISPSLNVS
jgi:hypothetical protein